MRAEAVGPGTRDAMASPMIRTPLFLLLVSSIACASSPDAPGVTDSETAGATTVVGPDGSETHLDPNDPEPIDALASRFSEDGCQVDLGEGFERAAIGGEPGQRLVVDGTVLETWTFEDTRSARAFAARFSHDGRLFDGTETPWLETTRVWLHGRMVVMFVGDEASAIALLDGYAIRATMPVQPDSNIGPAEVESRVRHEALVRFDLGENPLVLVARERVVFADACLEVRTAAEVCDDVETPGWRLVFAHGDDRLIAHTDESLSRIFWRSNS